jgi:anhydro-N-acetylmuramic acid kinase
MTSSPPTVHAIGLMSGTSLDGVDAALIDTDGAHIAGLGPSLTLPYDAAVREAIRAVLGKTGETAAEAAAIAEAAQALTEVHARAVGELLALAGLTPEAIDVVGFHGQTISHAPERRHTRQIGDAALLAEETGIRVVHDFRSADVRAGGQGAPLVPAFHQAMAVGLHKPLAILNIGGVANVTYLRDEAARPYAFDTGPGCALIDDWARRRTGALSDVDGALAAAGRVDTALLAAWMSHPFFGRRGPKSLDREEFRDLAVMVDNATPEDGAATLTAFTAAAVAQAGTLLPEPPLRWLVAGGGRHNPVLMAALRHRLPAPVDAVEAVGWDGDALEAQAFAFLAVRSLRGLPLTWPSTTGVPDALTGGVAVMPSGRLRRRP